MKHYCLIALITLLLSCKKSGHTESDFTGKTFTARIKMDSTVKDPMVLGVLASASISFEFKQGGTGIYRAGMGAATSERPFKWSVKSDSLTIQNEGDGEGKTSHYSIKNIPNGLLINDGQMPFELTQK